MPDVKQAQETGNINEGLYASLLAKGSLLRREDGPAHKVVEKSIWGENAATLLPEEYREKGVRQKDGVPATENPGKLKPQSFMDGTCGSSRTKAKAVQAFKPASSCR
ncbi:MAG: hypothetical protein KGL10_00010 [Alphaproteobacteria bacterium]|nr:hypothetical protein [Alphaproteobacteria bacterium]